MRSRIRSFLVLVAVGLSSAASVGVVRAQAMKPASPALVKMLHAEMHRNVGKVLPQGITVTDSSGRSVDLRSQLKALHSPVVLVALTSGCAPCKNILDNIRKHPDVYTQARESRLVILQVLDPQHTSLSLPAKVLEFQIAGKLDTGFLASERIPEAFVFDRHLKLIDRRVGVGVIPKFLSYPDETPAKDP